MEAIRSAKIVEVLGPDFKDQGGSGAGQMRGPRRSASKDRVRRESIEAVAYDKGGIPGQEDVSIAVEWAGDGVSVQSTLQQ